MVPKKVPYTGLSWNLNLRDQKWKPSTSLQFVSHSRQPHPSSGAQSWHLGCCQASRQGEQPYPPPLYKNRNFCWVSFALGGRNWCLDTPLPAGSTEERMKRTFHGLRSFRGEEKLHAHSDKPYKNGFFLAEKQRLQKNLGWKLFTNSAKVWSKGGNTKGPLSTSLTLFYFSGYLVAAQITRDDWERDALLGVF